jgi:predicted DNA-binding transcriptional regulator AlpA
MDAHRNTLPVVIGLSELCSLLAMSEITFRRRRKALEAAGFPRSLPGMGARWSKRAVAMWINGQSSTPISNDNGSIDVVVMHRDWLESRVGQLP